MSILKWIPRGSWLDDIDVLVNFWFEAHFQLKEDMYFLRSAFIIRGECSLMNFSSTENLELCFPGILSNAQLNATLKTDSITIKNISSSVVIGKMFNTTSNFKTKSSHTNVHSRENVSINILANSSSKMLHINNHSCIAHTSVNVVSKSVHPLLVASQTQFRCWLFSKDSRSSSAKR